MIRFAREFRLVPVVLVAIGALFVLKVAGLVVDGGYTLGGWRASPTSIRSSPSVRVASPAISLEEPAPAAGSDPGRQSWAREMFNFPDITGSVGAKPAAKEEAGKDAAKDSAKEADRNAAKEPPAKVPETLPAKSGTVVPFDGPRMLSAAERAVLERLQERRIELEARARELDVRESLLKAAEKRIEGQVNELKETESRITVATQKRDEAEAARFKALVTMYENMKAKDAARIFDRLDLKILVDVTNQINPRRMADILASMSSEAAERLTVELATRASLGEPPVAAPATSDLPKIEGRPSGG